MGEFVSYTIKGAVLLAAMFAVYGLTLSRLKCAALRRAILLAIYFCALTIPVFISFGTDEATVARTALTAPTAEFAFPGPAEAATESAAGNAVYGWIAAIAISGMAVSLLYFLTCLLIMVRYHLRSHKGVVDGQNVRIINGMKASPFCFGRNVYVSSEDLGEERRMVLGHEMSHARHLHFLDLILGRAVAIMQWWNPLAWMMMNELHQVHEFQADEDVIEKGFDIKSYQYMLVGVAMRRNIMPLGNNMAQSRLKSRLRMINREDSSRGSRLLTLLMLPAAFLALSLLGTDAVAGVLDSIGKARWIPAPITAGVNTAPAIPYDTIRKNSGNTVPKGSAAKVSDEKIEITHVKTVKKPEAAVSTKDAEVTKGKSPDDPRMMTYMVDGHIFSIDELKKIDPTTIKSITVRKNMEEYPGGLVIIDLFTPEEMTEREKTTAPPDSIN